jgi:phosphoglycerate dehydrogenase-like enzyme
MHRPEDLQKLLPEADFVMVTAPHTDATHHLIGAAEIALLKSGAGIVNYSRANLVDYEALRARLERREISAVLDVFSPEPLPADSPLWWTPNLILTPHSSSDDTALYTPKTLDLVMRNVERLLDGKKLLNRVSPTLQY